MRIKSNFRNLKWRTERALGEQVLNYNNQGKINIIDVGALGWLPSPWNKFRNITRVHHILRFEPQEEASNNKNITTVSSALWDQNCRRAFYIFADHAGGASLFEQNYEYVRENFSALRQQGPPQLADSWFERSKLETVRMIDCQKLDDVLTDLDKPFPFHFLKIDAQGAEYQILRGAENFLKTDCIGLQIELFEIPIMKGIKLLPEVVGYLESMGYELIEKVPTVSTFNAAFDCLFLKKKRADTTSKMIINVYGLAA